MYNMEALLWTAIVILFFMIKFAKREIKELKEKVDRLYKGEIVNIETPHIDSSSEALQNHNIVEETSPAVSDEAQEKISLPYKQNTQIEKKETNLNFFGQNLITWIASFAAILGAFYFVKYSIDNELLTPKARMIIAAVLGLVFIAYGFVLWSKKNNANNERISQALIGAGIATLYFVAYAISKIYGFVPLSTSFILMCMITASTVFITLKLNKIPVAVLGLIGGYLTPALVSSNNSTVISFSGYLFVLSMAFLLIARKFASVLIITLSLIAIYGWIFIWMFLRYSPFDSGWLMALVAAITAGVCLLFPASEKPEWKRLQNTAIGMGLFIAFCFLIKTKFDLFEWGIIGLMLSGLVTLCLFKPKTYLPTLSTTYIFTYAIFIYSCCFSFRNSLNSQQEQLVYLGLSFVGFLPFYISLWIKKNRNLLAFTSVFAPLTYGLYYIIFDNHEIYPYIGMAVFLIMALVVFTFNLSKEEDQKDAGIIILSATGILTMALASYLDISFLPIVLAIEILLLGLIKSFTGIQKLNVGIWALLAVFAANQIENLTLALRLFVAEQVDNYKFYAADMDTNFFVASIIIPTVSFGILSCISKDKFIKGAFGFLSGAIGLFGAFAFYMLIRMKFDDLTSSSPTFGEHAFITNVLLIVSLGSIYFKDSKVFYATLGLGLWRLVAINLIAASPLANNIDISMGGIIHAYTIPMIIMSVLAYYGRPENKGFFSWVAALLSFVLISFIILQANYGTLYLNKINHTPTGIFALSMGWLILGCIWLAFAFRNKSLVMPAFGLIYFVIAKVFLYDVSSLDGIYRVIALFGLAGSLLGISHFYAKYFQAPKAKKA